jgi:hypothetical protein
MAAPGETIANGTETGARDVATMIALRGGIVIFSMIEGEVEEVVVEEAVIVADEMEDEKIATNSQPRHESARIALLPRNESLPQTSQTSSPSRRARGD